MSQNNAFSGYTSLPITRTEEHNRAWPKLEEEVSLAIESRWRAEEEKKHSRIEAEEEEQLVEAGRVKAEEEE